MSTLLDPEASPARSHDLTRPLHIARKSGVVSSTSEDLELRLISHPSTASLIVQNEPLRIIYEHFIHVTVHRLPVATFVRNPFVTHMIPLAQSKGLIMHCMLAVRTMTLWGPPLLQGHNRQHLHRRVEHVGAGPSLGQAPDNAQGAGR